MTHSSPTTEVAVPASSFAQARETRRVRAHLRRVERALRRQPIPQLSPGLRMARGQHLDTLRSYWKQGRFARNFDRPGEQAPCFIDRGGHVCAVAHLLIESGQAPLAAQVAATANNAYIAEIHAPAFDDWVAGSGLTKEELARIQPSYPSIEDLQRLGTEMARLTHSFFGIGAAFRALRERVGTFLAGRPVLRRLMPVIIAGAVILMTFMSTLVRQVHFARARLPVYPYATTQSVQDGWALFSDLAEKRYTITLRTADSPADVQRFYERAIAQKGWTLQAKPDHISAHHYRDNPSGRDENADMVTIDIWLEGRWTYARVSQFYGTVFFSSD
jgi:hypothetical protein